MFRRFLLASAIAVFFALPAQAEKIRGSDFKSGNWDGAAYTSDQTGEFSHCAMSVGYKSGIRLHFAIDSKYFWRMGLSNKSWKLSKDKPVPMRYQVDRHRVFSVKGKVITSSFFLAELVAKDEVFNQFRRGRLLKMEAGREYFEFKLTGTSRALSTLLRCTRNYINYSAPVARSPQTEDLAPKKGNIFADSPQDLLDATRFLASLFASSEFSGFRLTDQSRLSDSKSSFLRNAAAGWNAPDGNGTLHVLRAGTKDADEALADMISTNSKACDGSFASGKRPGPDNSGIKTAFAACKIGETFKFHNDYIAFSRPNGQVYLLSNFQVGKQTVNTAISEALARNVAIVTE